MLFKILIAVAVLASFSTLFSRQVNAQSPAPGHYYYGNHWGGEVEALVLPQPEAKIFADGVTGSSGLSFDTTSQKLVNRLINDGKLFAYGGGAIEVASKFTGWFGAAWGAAWWWNNNQIESNGNDWSAEVVKFWMWNGIVYRADSYDFQDGRVIQGSGATVYQVDGGAKFGIPSPNELYALGHWWSDIARVSDEQITNMSNIPRDGTILRELSNPEVDLVTWKSSIWGSGHKRFHFLNGQAIYNEGHSWNDVRLIPDGSLSQIPYGGDIQGFYWGDSWTNLR